MNRDEKAAVIDQVATQIKESEAVFAVDYRGITVEQVAALRLKLEEADASLRVVKNTLTERAADKAGAESLKELLVGPTAFTFVRGDAALAAKAIAAFHRLHQVPEFKGGTLDGQLVSVADLQALALLPARPVLHGQLVGMLAAPLSGLAGGLNALIQGLAMQLGQIAEQGLVSGVAPPPPAAEETPAPEAEVPAENEAPAAEAAPAAAEAPAEAAEEEAEATPTPEAEAEPAAEAEAAPPAAETPDTETSGDPPAENETEPDPDTSPEGDDQKEG